MKTLFKIQILSLSVVLAAFCSQAEKPLIIHEWGTITTRHFPGGTVQGRLNRILPSEVLPSFVHNFEPSQTQNPPARRMTKSPATPGRPDVTMRLETPVIYIYRPEGSTEARSLDIGVEFRGGILNEFYPKADAAVTLDNERLRSKQSAGIIQAWSGDLLNNFVRSSLQWTGVSTSDRSDVPETDSPIWLAPREVGSEYLVTPDGELEKYLFYRGVAHLDALFQTQHSSTNVQLIAPAHLHWLSAPSMQVDRVWVAEILEDGRAAFEKREQVMLLKNETSQVLMNFPLPEDRSYSKENMDELKHSMYEALVARGLFQDEALAMLATWEKSYFGSPGLRIFYMVPDEWTNYFLPMSISTPNELTRVLVGRIDLLEKKSSLNE